MAISKGSHNPILRGQQRSPWLLTTETSPGMILQVREVDPCIPRSCQDYYWTIETYGAAADAGTVWDRWMDKRSHCWATPLKFHREPENQQPGTEDFLLETIIFRFQNHFHRKYLRKTPGWNAIIVPKAYHYANHHVYFLGGGFKYFLFLALFGEDSHFDSYFSNGLKPPTSFAMQSLEPQSFWERKGTVNMC